MAVRGLENPQHAALITIECQNGPTNPAFSGRPGLAQQCEERGIIKKIAVLAAAFRARSLPVFHGTLAHRDDWAGSNINSPLLGSNRKKHKMLRGGPDVELHPDLGAQPTDFVLERIHGVTAFYGTPLDQMLRNCGVKTVVLTGVSTNLGIPGAAIEAVNRGYSVVIPEDCTAGVWPEAHEFVISQFLPPLGAVTTSEDVIDCLNARP
jgi:nicotinamidase-related amidase